MNEAARSAYHDPTPRMELLEDVKIDVPVRWHGQTTIHVQDPEENDAMMTVAPDAVLRVIEAAYHQDTRGAQVDLWLDSSGLHILDVCIC